VGYVCAFWNAIEPTLDEMKISRGDFDLIRRDRNLSVKTWVDVTLVLKVSLNACRMVLVPYKTARSWDIPVGAKEVDERWGCRRNSEEVGSKSRG